MLLTVYPHFIVYNDSNGKKGINCPGILHDDT